MKHSKKEKIKMKSYRDFCLRGVPERCLLPNWTIIPLLVFMVLLTSCNPADKVPGEFPQSEEMAHILADLYLSENIIGSGSEGIHNTSSKEIYPGYYKDVLDKYNLSSERFDTIRRWYAAHPYLFQEVYDQTIVILNQRDAEVKQQLDAEKKEQIANKNLWTELQEYTTHANDTIDPRLPFSIPVDSVKRGYIRLWAFYQLLKEDMTRDARMVLMMHYNDSTVDTVSYDLPLSFQKKAATLSCPVDTGKIGLKVSGFLFDHDTLSVTSVKVSDIRLEYLPHKAVSLSLKKDDRP